VNSSQLDKLEGLAGKALTGDTGATARLLTVALSGGESADCLSEVLQGRERTAHIVGVTGPPGAGKSTLVGALAHAWPGEGRTAILAIDPTSPITGGAILGDRVRMKQLSGDSRVYVRSVASHGRTDGLALGIERATDVLSTLNFDTVLIETVGVGQVEVEITSLADTTVAVFTPGQGDVVQAVKSGLNEVTDIFVVNKADLGGADSVIRDLRRVTRAAVESAAEAETTWQRPVLGTSATDKEGLSALIEQIGAHREFLERSGEGVDRRTRRGQLQIGEMLNARWHFALTELMTSSQGREMSNRVAMGEVTAHGVTPSLMSELLALIDRQDQY